jgi:dynein heavy chain
MWATEGLPIDPLSVENGAIMTNASRWPLMIDPQLQVRAARAGDACCWRHRRCVLVCGGPTAVVLVHHVGQAFHLPACTQLPLATQGIKWIKSREAAAGLVIVQQSQPKYIDKVIACIESGTPLLFENLPIDIDAGARACAQLWSSTTTPALAPDLAGHRATPARATLAA